MIVYSTLGFSGTATCTGIILCMWLLHAETAEAYELSYPRYTVYIHYMHMQQLLLLYLP